MSKESKSYKNSPKKVYIRTFGCQMNVRDSEALAGLFLENGWSLTDIPEAADAVLINTCSVREHAEHRAISFLGSLKKKLYNTQKKAEDNLPRPKPVIGLIGCMARNRGEEIFKKMPYINLICGPANFDKIPAYVDKIINAQNKENNAQRIINLEDRLRDETFYHSSFKIKRDWAQVVISTGCSNYCSYCIVPFVRGPLRLRRPKDIIDEVKRNVKMGIKKITLLGQNVNDYMYQPLSVNFVDLLKMAEEVKGIEEIDFITNHPKNTSKRLFETIARSKKIRKHLHLPFQSGSDRILKLMNRKYTKNEYLALIKDYKEITGGTLSTDIIIGFPTETNEDFLETKDIIERAKFKTAYIFKYSPRPHSHCFSIPDDVPKDVKEKRHSILLSLQKDISTHIKEKKQQF